MKNIEIVETIMNTARPLVRSDTKIELHPHNNGYTVCMRTPDGTNRVGAIEWSYPCTFTVWGIQGKEKIERVAKDFLNLHYYLMR